MSVKNSTVKIYINVTQKVITVVINSFVEVFTPYQKRKGRFTKIAFLSAPKTKNWQKPIIIHNMPSANELIQLVTKTL